MGFYVFGQNLGSLEDAPSIFTHYQDLCQYLTFVKPWDILHHKEDEPHSDYSTALVSQIEKCKQPLLETMENVKTIANSSLGFCPKFLSLIDKEHVDDFPLERISVKFNILKGFI